MSFKRPTTKTIKAPRNKGRNKGFTLVEILVSLSIIAIAMGALIQASGDNTNSLSYLKQKSLAHWVAMNEITRLEVERNWPSLGTDKDDVEMAGHTWYWTRTTEKTANENIRQISFVVYLDEDRERNLTHLVSFLIKPMNGSKIK